MEKTEKIVKVKALGPYKVNNKIFESRYIFEAGKEYYIPERHLNVLLDAKVIEVIK